MLQDPTNTMFWTIMVCEFLAAFGLITYLAQGEKRHNKPQ